MEKYFNDAVIGNQSIVASYTKNGELIRIFYPNRDYKQILDFFHTGLKINDSRLIYLHQDINNIYNQTYENREFDLKAPENYTPQVKYNEKKKKRFWRKDNDNN